MTAPGLQFLKLGRHLRKQATPGSAGTAFHPFLGGKPQLPHSSHNTCTVVILHIFAIHSADLYFSS